MNDPFDRSAAPHHKSDFSGRGGKVKYHSSHSFHFPTFPLNQKSRFFYFYSAMSSSFFRVFRIEKQSTGCAVEFQGEV